MIVESLSELQMYINFLEQFNNIVYTNHQKLIEDLKREFNINVTEEELNRIYEPTIDEEILDRSVLLKNIFSW